jgi:hypothetical protein
MELQLHRLDLLQTGAAAPGTLLVIELLLLLLLHNCSTALHPHPELNHACRCFRLVKTKHRRWQLATCLA